MKKILRLCIVTVILCAWVVLLASCSKDHTDYEHLRELSWEGKELTITLGENKSSGCEWTTHPEDDSVIDYSLNRVFHLADSQLVKGDAIGSLDAGFEGKGGGTTRIICTTPVGWDGTGDGLAYIVTVTVGEDGTIEKAEGQESESVPETDTAQPEQTAETEAVESDSTMAAETTEAEATLEDYFANHTDELEEMRKNLNEDETYKDQVSIDLDVKGNTISYIYTFKETYSDDQIDQIGPELSKSMEGEELKEDMKGRIKTIEEGYGISGVRMYMEYRNGDGARICDTTFE